MVVTTTMMTRGGEHAELGISRKVDEAKKRHSKVKIAYAWPYEESRVARLISEHVEYFLRTVGYIP